MSSLAGTPVNQWIDPKNDFAFKRIFGTERNKDILIHFINDILGFKNEEEISEVTFLKPNQDPSIASKKQSLVDVLCADKIGRQYIVEMQVARTEGFEKRAQCYAAKAYTTQLNQGEDYTRLKEIIFIAITDFVMFPDKKEYYSTHCLLDKISYTHDLKDFSFTFLELPKFKKSFNELNTIIEKWAYFFKHGFTYREKDDPAGRDQIFLRACEELNEAGWTEEDLRTYEAKEKIERDHRAVLNFKLGVAEKRGERKGIKRGRREGREEGHRAGIAEGIERGIEQALHAVNLLKIGHSLEEISNKTGLKKAMLKKLL